MEELIQYLSCGRCIAFIGTGPSCEIGAPSWEKLCQAIVNDIEQRHRDVSPEMKSAISQKEYPKFFDEVFHKYGKNYLYDTVKLLLKDSDQKGSIYSQLLDIPFHSYFTTNYDNQIKLHLEYKGKSAISLLNRKVETAKIDLDSQLTYIFKIHGDFSDESSLILTEDQYFAFHNKDEYGYLRDFLKGCFLTKRFLIVGYSLNDPHILDLLKKIAANLRRQTPIYAILEGVGDATIKELDKRCNIKVMRYKNNSGTHKELFTILEAIAKFVNVVDPATQRDTEIDLKKAQCFYMWYKFQSGDNTFAWTVDSLKSVILTIVNDHYKNKEFSLYQLNEKIKEIFSLDRVIALNIFQESIKNLVELKYIAPVDKDQFKATESLYLLVKKYQGQYGDLIDSFNSKVEIDFKNYQKNISSENLRQIGKAIHDIIIDLFTERATELINMVFIQKPILIQNASNLFRLINSRSKDITNVELRYKYISYVSDLLTKPDKIQEAVFEYYSKAYLSIQSLQIDPIGQEIKSRFLKSRKLIVDSNIIIPLASKQSIDNQYFVTVCKEAKKAGIEFLTTNNLIQEVFEHVKWAKDLIEKHGEQSVEVLSASLGNYPYKRNAFLDGYIRYCVDTEHISFEDYLKLIFNTSEVSPKAIQKWIENEFGFTIKNLEDIQLDKMIALPMRDNILKLIETLAEDSPSEKKHTRMRAESEVYTMIFNWGQIKKEVDEECSFLSQGGFLNRLARESDYRINRNIIIRSDALYEFVVRSGPRITQNIPFRDVMLSSYFRGAEYFVDKKKYSQYFSSLINEAEKTYRSSIKEFQKYVDKSLSTDSMDEYFDLQKPLVLYSLQTDLSAKLKQKEKENAELRIIVDVQEFTIQETQKELGRYKTKENNMKKYAQKQKRAQLKRKGRK